MIGIAFVRIELHGKECVKKDYRGYRMLVPILHNLCVKLVTKNSREVKTLLGTSVRQLGHGERNASHGLGHYWWGASSFGWLYFNGSMVCVCAALVLAMGGDQAVSGCPRVGLASQQEGYSCIQSMQCIYFMQHEEDQAVAQDHAIVLDPPSCHVAHLIKIQCFYLVTQRPVARCVVCLVRGGGPVAGQAVKGVCMCVCVFVCVLFVCVGKRACVSGESISACMDLC